MSATYRVFIRYLSGIEEEYIGSHRQCARLRNRAFRMGHGIWPIERVGGAS